MSALHQRSVLMAYLRPQTPRVLALAAFLLGGIGLQLVAPLIVRQFIDTAAKGGAEAPVDYLWLLAGAFIVVAIVTQLVQVGAAYFSEQVGWAATNAMRRDLAEHVMHLDMSFHTARTPGELIERVDGDVAALAAFFSQFVIQILGGALLLTGIVITLFLQDARVGAALTVFGVVALIALHATRNIAAQQFEDERQAYSDLSGFLEERIGGLDDIRANGAGAYVMRRMGGYNQNLISKGVAAGRRSLWIWIMTGSIFAVGFVTAISLGAYLYLENLVTIGTVFMFVQYTGMMGDPLIRIGQQLQQFQAAAAGLNRVREMRSFTRTIVDGAGAGWENARTQAPRLAFEDVRFAYDERAQVIDGVSFQLEPGKVLGLLGRTGSGKTTLTRLLFRLYDPQAGRIAIDGADIRDATLTELRARIGLVTQDVQLFEASIRDNATMFDRAVPDERVQQVLTDLGLGAWLSRQKNGLETVLVGAGGLSAGEAQLLAFARVFLKDPGLVVLDEASSRLDPATDRLIEHAMDDLLGARKGGSPRTAIIIAHKLDTVRRADQILILDRGRVLEAGDRATLAANPDSHFARLLRSGIEEVLT